VADTLTGDIVGLSERADFATLSALVSRDPHVTGDPAEYNCFTTICESAVCFKIFVWAQTNPVWGRPEEGEGLLISLHTGPIQPCYATD